jgi:hypothetical protein
MQWLGTTDQVIELQIEVAIDCTVYWTGDAIDSDVYGRVNEVDWVCTLVDWRWHADRSIE